MAIDPVVPRSRRNVLAAAAAGLAGLLAERFARPEPTDATTGAMVYGTVMDEGVDQTSLTSSGAFTAVFHNTGSGVAVQAWGAGGQAAVVGANVLSGGGVLGESPSGNAVQGLSTTGTGVNGISTSGLGVVGTSTSSIGVIGGSAATDQPGLYGQSTGNNTGVIGISGGGSFNLPATSPARTGVYGYVAQDATAAGVKGESIGGTGAVGVSNTGPGVQGTSTSGNGVVGTSSSSFGVLGTSATAIGVGASSTAGAQPALRGLSESSNTGVFGFSRGFVGDLPPATPAETGVYGYATQNVSAMGVMGESVQGSGVVGQSNTGVGVLGESNSNGVKGISTGLSYGVYGTSNLGTGIAGASSAANAPAILGLAGGGSTGILGVSGTLPPAPPAETGVCGYAAQSAAAVGVRGESTIGTAIVGQSASNVGIVGFVGSSTPPTVPVGTAMFGASAIGGHDLYAGGSGRIGFLPNLSAGPPATGTYATGDVFCDAGGSMWVCVAGGTPGSFRKLAGPATAGALHAIDPARVYDSRLSDGPLAVGGIRTISVATATAGRTVVPAGAIAIAYNLTITGSVGGGWLGIVPHAGAFGGTSSINWFAAAQTLANGGIVKLGGDRQCDIWSGGRAGASTQFIVDITGYYL